MPSRKGFKLIKLEVFLMLWKQLMRCMSGKRQRKNYPFMETEVVCWPQLTRIGLRRDGIRFPSKRKKNITKVSVHQVLSLKILSISLIMQEEKEIKEYV